MHIDRTKYTAHYENGALVSQWISVEMSLDSSESEVVALNRSKQVVEQWHKDNNPVSPYGASVPPGPPPVITIERSSEDQRIAELIRDIYACTEIEGPNGLLTYRKLAEANEEACAVFDIMTRKLLAKNK